MARPPFRADRLSLDADGRAVYALRRRWRDGTAAVVFEPLYFIAGWRPDPLRNAADAPLRFVATRRTGAYLPRPRAYLLTYHGVLAPADEWRDDIVPGGSARKSPCRPDLGRGLQRASNPQA